MVPESGEKVKTQKNRREKKMADTSKEPWDSVCATRVPLCLQGVKCEVFAFPQFFATLLFHLLKNTAASYSTDVRTRLGTTGSQYSGRRKGFPERRKDRYGE